MTSSIARMNLFLHGVEDFEIVRGDTLAEPAASSRATACASSTWSSPIRRTPSSSGTARRGAADPWGRNFLGTPPQGRADYAFLQHILASLDAEDRALRDPLPARRAVPQRGAGDARASCRSTTVVECVLGLGPEPLLQLADGGVHRHLPIARSRRHARARCCSSTR